MVAYVTDLHAMNEAMVTRLLSEPAVPVPEGGYALRVLETTGRATGRAVWTPLGVLRLHGIDYVVTPDRTRDWARNLRRTPACAAMAGQTRTEARATPVDGDRAAEVVRGYLAVVAAPWALAAFGLPADPTLDDIRPELARIGVFRLDPA